MDSADQVAEILLLLPELSRRLRPKARQGDPGARPSLAQVKAMTHLGQYGQQTMTELARGLDISLPAATDLVDRLLAAGLAERVRDDRDRRIVLVQLSPEAQARIQPVLLYRRRAVEGVLNQLSAEEQQGFLRGLYLLTKALATEREIIIGERGGD